MKRGGALRALSAAVNMREEDSYLRQRVLDALLREDVRGCVSQATLAGAEQLAGYPGAWGRPAGAQWLRLPHIQGGVLWIPVQPAHFMQQWRSTAAPLLWQEGMRYTELLTLDHILECFGRGLAGEGQAMYGAFAAECRLALEHRRIADAERERWFGQLRAPGPSGRDAPGPGHGGTNGWHAALLHYDRLASFHDHPLYPTARARQGFDRAALEAYGPESQQAFQLRWVALPRGMVSSSGDAGPAPVLPPLWPVFADVGLAPELDASHVLLPVHPYAWGGQLDAALAASGLAAHAIAAPLPWLTVASTLSVRTVALLEAPGWHIKLPLAPRMPPAPARDAAPGVPASSAPSSASGLPPSSAPSTASGLPVMSGLASTSAMPASASFPPVSSMRPTSGMPSVSGFSSPSVMPAAPDGRHACFLAADAMRDCRRVQALLGAVAAREPAYARRVLLAGEGSGAHAGRGALVGYALRRYPEAALRGSDVVAVASLAAAAPQGGLVAQQLAARHYGGDLLAFFDDYLELTLGWHLTLWLRYGVALSATQQNTLLVLADGDSGTPRLRLLVRNGASARVHSGALARRWPQLAAVFADLPLAMLPDTPPATRPATRPDAPQPGATAGKIPVPPAEAAGQAAAVPASPVEVAGDMPLARLFVTCTLQWNVGVLAERYADALKTEPAALHRRVRACVENVLARLAAEGEDTAPARRVLLDSAGLCQCLMLASALAEPGDVDAAPAAAVAPARYASGAEAEGLPQRRHVPVYGRAVPNFLAGAAASKGAEATASNP